MKRINVMIAFFSAAALLVFAACSNSSDSGSSGANNGNDGGTATTPTTTETPTGGDSGGGSGSGVTTEGFVSVAGTTVSGAVTGSQVFITNRTVAIPTLYVCDHEVTQGEYETYCKYGSTAPGDTIGKGANFPAYYVSWYDAVVYCNLRTIAEFGGEAECVYTLNGKAHPKDWPGIVGNATERYCGPLTTTDDWDYKGGTDVGIKFDPTKKGYRLPTEAEWEYIARNKNSDSFTYSGSDTVGDVAWYNGNSGNKTHEVKTNKTNGKDSANGLGIYDMSGNVWEWCHDWYDSITASTDPLGASSGSYRVYRGGCWFYNAGYCSVASRSNSIPINHFGNVGFRVVRTAN